MDQIEKLLNPQHVARVITGSGEQDKSRITTDPGCCLLFAGCFTRRLSEGGWRCQFEK